jgi:hypothetical protein
MTRRLELEYHQSSNDSNGRALATAYLFFSKRVQNILFLHNNKLTYNLKIQFSYLKSIIFYNLVKMFQIFRIIIFIILANFLLQLFGIGECAERGDGKQRRPDEPQVPQQRGQKYRRTTSGRSSSEGNTDESSPRAERREEVGSVTSGLAKIALDPPRSKKMMEFQGKEFFQKPGN